MTRRQENAWIVAIAFMFGSVIVGGWFLASAFQPKSVAFVDPAIWSEPYTGGVPRIQPEI